MATAPCLAWSSLRPLTSSQAHIAYKNTTVFDQSQNASLYRRDLIYTAEYPTILSVSAPAMLFGDLALNAIDVSV